MGGIFFAEDDSARFYEPAAGTITTEHLDRIVDTLKNTQTRVLILDVNDQKTNFPSKSWEPFCAGFDPEKGIDQPFFHNSSDHANDQGFFKWAMNMRTLFDKGIDSVDYLLERGRKNGFEVWISMRMNDMHDGENINSPIHSEFWRNHPEYWISKTPYDNGLDFAKKPVRDYAMSLVLEVLDRYDIDGFLLDWLRWPAYFSPNVGLRGCPILTEWIGDVRRAVDAVQKKRGKSIKLIARVPSSPVVARELGLDAVMWAKKALINHLIAGPFFLTTDFDVPVEKWDNLLKDTGVPVTVGLETQISSFPEDKCKTITCEQLRGAAIGALHRGSNGIYLFNMMGWPAQRPHLFQELGSIETLITKDRDYVQTWLDCGIPLSILDGIRGAVGTSRADACLWFDTKIKTGEYSHILPRTIFQNETASFQLYTGPKPIKGTKCALFLTTPPSDRKEQKKIQVAVNGKTAKQETEVDHRIPFFVDCEELTQGYTAITVTNLTASELKITGVELTMRF